MRDELGGGEKEEGKERLKNEGAEVGGTKWNPRDK